MSQSFRLPALFWIGLAVLVVGSVPLFGFIVADSMGLLADPEPNPVGPGLIFFVSFWAGLIAMAIGLVRALFARRGGRKPARRALWRD